MKITDYTLSPPYTITVDDAELFQEVRLIGNLKEKSKEEIRQLQLKYDSIGFMLKSREDQQPSFSDVVGGQRVPSDEVSPRTSDPRFTCPHPDYESPMPT